MDFANVNSPIPGFSTKIIPALLTAEDFWFFCDLYLQFIGPISLWNKSIDLRLFLKCNFLTVFEAIEVFNIIRWWDDRSIIWWSNYYFDRLGIKQCNSKLVITYLKLVVWSFKEIDMKPKQPTHCFTVLFPIHQIKYK